MYEDYYSQYEETHGKVNNAFSLSSSKEVSRNLTENITNATEKIGRCKIGGENDNIISSYNEVVNSYLNRLDNLYAFSASYADVELAYSELYYELGELKTKDEEFKEKSQQPPSSSNSKYAITNEDGTPGINYELYYSDLSKWELEVSSYKKCCKTLSDNIKNYIDYLASVNSFDPKEGQIQVSVDRPSYFSGDELFNKYSYINDNFLDENTIESKVLEEEDLEQFLKTNDIPNGEHAIVYKKTVMVNGIPITTYSVFDKECSPEENKSFERYINKSLEYESKIDPAILTKIFTGENASSIIFTQTPRLDIWSVEEGNMFAAAYYQPNTYNITMLYPGSEYFDYYNASIVHETGHAYDHKLSIEKNGDQWSYCGGDSGWKKIILEEVNCFDSASSYTIPGFESKEKAQEYYDSYCLNAADYEIVEFDGNWQINVSYENPVTPSGVTINGWGGGYNIHQYVEWPHEYFADSFQAYWLGDMESDEEGGMSKLEFLCPETYRALNSLIENDINNYIPYVPEG